MVLLRRFGILILGVLLLVGGVVQLIWSFVIESSSTFGWTAYAPLTSTSFSPPPEAEPLGPALFIAGVVLIAGWWRARRARSVATDGLLRRYGLLALGVLILACCGIALGVSGSASYAFTSLQGSGPSVVWMPPTLVIRQTLSLLAVSTGFGCIAGWVGGRVGRRTAKPR